LAILKLLIKVVYSKPSSERQAVQFQDDYLVSDGFNNLISVFLMATLMAGNTIKPCQAVDIPGPAAIMTALFGVFHAS
jgi:hypothetical protein